MRLYLCRRGSPKRARSRLFNTLEQQHQKIIENPHLQSAFLNEEPSAEPSLPHLAASAATPPADERVAWLPQTSALNSEHFKPLPGSRWVIRVVHSTTSNHINATADMIFTECASESKTSLSKALDTNQILEWIVLEHQ